MENNINIDTLREIVKGFQKKKRFIHTLGVEQKAIELGEIFMPEKLQKLQIAGLLHDITKDFSTDEHFRLCDEYKIKIDKEKIAPKLLHAITGCEFSKRKLGSDVVDDEIYQGIRYHTTGRENMTLFEQIIYLADYIEENRDFSDCVLLRNYFENNIEKCSTMNEKLIALKNTMILSFNFTIKNLIEEGKLIDFDTINARNYFLNL